MKLTSTVLGTLLVLVSGSSRAAEPPPGDPLLALSWFVGGSWVAEIKSSDGRAMRVESKFAWADHGRALKYVIHFTSGGETVPQYEGVYYWHPGRKHIAMLQTDRGGNVTESVVTVEGTTLKQENQATQADGTTRPQRVCVTRRGDDTFDFTALVQRDGAWVEGVSLTYKRQRAADR
jgi:hypothetical protein